MNGDDEEFINAKAWNFRARDGTDDWAEMINNAQKQLRIKDEEEKEAKTVDFGIDAKKWERWVGSRDPSYNLNFPQ